MSCIREMSNNLLSTSGNEILDTLRFFHGDSPAREFESGQQKGGHYFCSNCGCHAIRVDEFDHVHNCPLISLQDRVNSIMMGSISKTKTLQNKLKPLKNLSIEELKTELASRDVYDGETKKDLENLLTSEMHGIQRVPALIINSPLVSLEVLGLTKYEILPTEPLHDIGHHIENVFAEFPHHLEAKEKEKIEESIAMSLGGKESKRGVDYRAALIKTTAYLRQNSLLHENALQVLDTLTEMQRILYSKEEKRSLNLILRYYNQSWLHGILLKTYIIRPKKLTLRKLFGVYFHDLIGHAGIMLRLISGQAANTEEEERLFHHIKRITKQTSNYNSGQIIPNLLVRLQAENEMCQRESVTKQQNFISDLSKSLPPLENTQIPLDIIMKHPRQWQAHLEEISDFLLDGEGAWWHLNSDTVEFHDISDFPPTEESHTQLHHFRSSTLKDEEIYLQQCWQQCIKENIALPTHVIRIELQDGQVRRINTNVLGNLSDDREEEPDKIICDDRKDHNNCESGDVEEEDEDEEDVIAISPTEDETVYIQEDEYMKTTNLTTNEQVHVPSTQDTSLIQDTKYVTSYVLQTCLGKAIEVVLGKTKEVENFDRKHFHMKKNNHCSKRNNIQDEENYKDCLALIQTKVLAENTKSQKGLDKWEKDYLLSNNLITPSYELMKADATASVLLNKLKYSKALLKEWNIRFY